MVPTWGQQLASACANSSWCQAALNSLNAAPAQASNWVAQNAPLIGTWADKIPAGWDWYFSSGNAQNMPQNVPAGGSNTAGPGGLDPNDPFTKLLQNIGPNTWQSPAGLRYGPDFKFGDRVQHVLAHTADDLSKSEHGVFTIGRNNVLPLLDEGWGLVQQGSAQVLSTVTQTNGYIVHNIDMGRNIGYYGGQIGAQLGNPTTSILRLVVHPTNGVITAFPVVP